MAEVSIDSVQVGLRVLARGPRDDSMAGRNSYLSNSDAHVATRKRSAPLFLEKMARLVKNA